MGWLRAIKKKAYPQATELNRLKEELRRVSEKLELREGELAETLEQQTATSQILRVIASSLTDIQPVLDAVVETAARICLRRHAGGVARRKALGGIRAGSRQHVLVHSAGISASNLRLVVSESILDFGLPEMMKEKGLALLQGSISSPYTGGPLSDSSILAMRKNQEEGVPQMRKKTRKESIRSLALSFLLPVTALLFALCLCLSAGSQQPRKIARIGYLSTGDLVSRGYRIEAFRQGLKELGYVEGKNIRIEYRYAGARSDRLPELARELVGLKVDIIFAGGTPATEAAKNATLTIPIVTSSSEPVESGLVASLAQPGGNITGLTNLTSELVGKRLELLKEVIPQLSHVAVLCTPGSDRRTWTRAEVAAQSLGVQLQAALVRDRDDLEPAFAAIKRDRAGALITIRSPAIVHDLRKRILDLADKSRLPAIYDDRIFSRLGGLMSYGVNLAELDRRAATYIDKILKGAKPANLPIEQPMKFELVINLKTAKALELKIPANLLVEAAAVIE